LALVLLDIDDFKQVNDTLGHSAGDRTLREFAAMLKSELRPDDRSARYGGEEFVLLLPGAAADGAVEMVRRLQRRLAERTLLGAAAKPQFTFSGGVTTVVGGDLAQALELADDALYEAKRSGKNRVCRRDPAQAACASRLVGSRPRPFRGRATVAGRRRPSTHSIRWCRRA